MCGPALFELDTTGRRGIVIDIDEYDGWSGGLILLDDRMTASLSRTAFPSQAAILWIGRSIGASPRL